MKITLAVNWKEHKILDKNELVELQRQDIEKMKTDDEDFIDYLRREARIVAELVDENIPDLPQVLRSYWAEDIWDRVMNSDYWAEERGLELVEIDIPTK